MDKMLLRVHQKKTKKHPRIKKKPIKVVYISNPMKVKTSASEFRALVQELTGQDADMPDPSKFSDIESVGGSSQGEAVLPYEMKAMEEDQVTGATAAVGYPGVEMPTTSLSDLSLGTFDNDATFMPEMLDNFPSGLVSSTSWFESTHAREVKSLDAM